MQQDNNNMDKKLKQLENQSLPDLSKMDEHWDDLKSSLQPEDSLPKNKPNKRIFRWIVAAALACISYFILYQFVLKNRDSNITLQKTEPVLNSRSSTDTLPTIQFIPGKETSTVIGKDTIKFTPQEQKTNLDTIILTGTTTDGKPIKLLATHVSNKKNRDTVSFTIKPQETKSLAGTVKAKTTDGKDVELKWTTVNGPDKKTFDTVNIKPLKDPTSKPIILKAKTTDGKEIEIPVTPVNDSTNKKPAVDKKKAIEDFFTLLKKESQSFVINNKRDTVIRGNAGTSLLIPANTFKSNEPVTITMKEYYSYEDMITNRLTTLSDNKLLVTGGMLHLIATVKGKEVDLDPGKTIRWFIPDTTVQMKQMQLFNGFVNKGTMRRLSEISDTAVVDFSRTINWVAQQQFFSNNYLYTNVKVLDLRDEPYKTRYSKHGKVGKFYIAPDANISQEELENYLVTKRGYSKVIIKKDDGWRRQAFSFRRRGWSYREALGDSLWMDIAEARRNNLKGTDTIVSRQAGVGKFEFDFKVYDTRFVARPFDTAFGKQNLNNLANKFSVDIRNLGWINCDRFYNDYRPKIEYVVNLGDTASNYYTLLVFDKIKSMMTGYVSGNKVSFQNVPEGETAKIVSISVRDGKSVAAMQTVQLSRKPLEGLKFEETTPTEFKEKAGGLDKP